MTSLFRRNIRGGNFGKAFNKRRFRRPILFRGKSIEGSAAALVVNVAVGFIFLRTTVGSSVWWWYAIQGVDYSGGFGEPLWPVILIMAVVAAVDELLISKISDNLTIPVISGFAGQVTLLLIRQV